MDVKKISIEDERYKKHKKTYNYAMEMTMKELSQSVEGMFHNLNSLQSRGGGQLPFSSINYGTCTLPEGRAVIKALIQGTIDGTGKWHKTSIFPCCIFQYDRNIHGSKLNPGPNYDLFRLALKATSKRIYPNYCNVNWNTNLKGNEFDRKEKRLALTMLSGEQYESLWEWLCQHPDYQDYMSLTPQSIYDKVHDKAYHHIEVATALKFTRYEVMATMGKWNNAAHVKPFEPCLMGVAA